MSRALVLAVALAGIALPVALGVYALTDMNPDARMAGDDLDAAVLAQAVTAETEASAEPMDLTPPGSAEIVESADLAALAEQDRQGAVALVRQALLDNPLMLDEAIAALEIARAAEQNSLVARVIEDNAERLFDDEHVSIMGNPDGAITLVEFLDYNCGYCKRAHNDVMRLIAEQDDVRVLVKDFPVLGPGSLEAAQVAIAFRSIGGDMQAFIDVMMQEDAVRADAGMARSVALDLGADETALDLALDSPRLMDPIAEAYALAEQLNIRGTPAFVIGRDLLMGAVGFEALSAAIEAERARLSAL